MKVSIFIPFYNAELFLPKLEVFLKEAENHGYELCFADSQSTDNTYSILHNSFSNINIYQLPSSDFDHGGTRSLAKDLCCGDIIIFLTQDALPLSVDDVENIVSVFDDMSIGAAYGRQLPYENTSLFGKHLREFNYSKNSYIRGIADKKSFGIKTAFLSNSFAAYRRSAMDKVGWFKNGLILGEDTYAGAKLLLEGYELAYVANAKVYHSHSYTLLEEFRRYFDIGVFHKMEHWILSEFGKPEGEGRRYILSEFQYLLNHNAYYLIPEYIVRNGMKLLGYKLGKNYDKLPKNWVNKFSMHRRWWNRQDEK